MMKKKKLLSMILASVMVVSVLSACSDNSENRETTTPEEKVTEAKTTTEKESEQSTEETEDADDKTASSERVMEGNMYVEGLPILEETETFTIAVPREANSKNTFAEKPVTIEMEKQTNVHIEWQETPSSGWHEKVNIMLASGDLPDAFSGEIRDLMKNLSLFVQLDEYVDKYGPNIQEMFTGQPDLKVGITAPDGHFYSLPTNRADPSSTVGHGLWINTEWLETVGKDIPTTTDEFVDVMKAFRDEDPNGNGKADEIPIGVFQDPNNGPTTIDPLFGSFGVVDTVEYVYADDEGKVLFTGEHEGYLKGLQWMNTLYTEKLMDQEVFTMSPAQFTAKAQSPDLIYGTIMCWLPDGMDSRYWDVYQAVPPLEGENGDKLWSVSRLPGGNLTGFTITTACEKPEVLIRYYDNNISTLENIMLWFNGPENEGIWKYDSTGTKWIETEEFMPEGANMGEFERTVAVGPSSPARLWSKYDEMRELEPRIVLKIDVNKMYLENAITVMPNGVEDPDLAAERSLLFTDIDSYMRKFKANSIVQGIDEAAWEDHLKTLENLRVSEYVEMWQTYYDAKM